MAIMLAKTYATLKAAGAPEGDAAAAAEELANYENRLASIDNRLAMLDGRLTALEARVSALESGLTQFRADVNAPLYEADLGSWYPTPRQRLRCWACC